MAQPLALRVIGRLGLLDPLAEKLQKTASGLLTRDGANTPLKSFLNGQWLGHPLHPALTDVPLGAWTGTVAMDLLAAVSGSEALAAGADASLALGIAGAAGAAAAGVADWSDTSGATRRTGMVHALLNSLALTLNLVSLVKRRTGNRGGGVLLSTAAYGIGALSAYLGGELVYAQGIGVSHEIWPEPPGEFTTVLDGKALPEGKLTRAMAGDVAVCLLRRGNEIDAFADWCTHLGGPLSEGKLEGETVTCPWHGSQFNVGNGAVERGPATIPVRRFVARLHEGKVQVKPRQ
jgi:nitrite reductase/ring-hydroxylating ferredoxin subunit/uncharacterized membrane protein